MGTGLVESKLLEKKLTFVIFISNDMLFNSKRTFRPFLPFSRYVLLKLFYHECYKVLVINIEYFLRQW